MRELLLTVLSLGVSGSLLMLVLMLLKPVWRRFSKGWQYYIWLVVLLRLLLPVAPEGNLVGRLFQNPGRDTPADAPPGEVVLLPAAPEGVSQAGQDAVPSPAPEKTGEAVKFDPASVLFLVWLGGAAALGVRKVTQYQSFSRCLRAGWREVDDPALLDLAAEAGAEAGVKRPVELCENGLIATPLLLGAFRPRILLPSVELPEEELKNILLHELVHCRRRDILYKWLVQLAVCLHWYLPTVWWMAREIDRAGELACDEAVIKKMDREQRRRYGDTLLRAMEGGGGLYPAPAAVTLNESGILLKERLGFIMEYRPQRKFLIGLSLAMAVLLAAGAVMAGAYTGPGTAAVVPDGADEEKIRLIQEQLEMIRRQKQEYEAWGITQEGDAYFYQGQRLRLLVDLRPADLSIIALTTDPQGTLCLRVRRGEDGAIASVSRMTEAEAAEFLDELEEPDDPPPEPDEETDLQEELERLHQAALQRQEEYETWGVTQRDGAWYYQGRRVYALSDTQPSLFANIAFYLDPQGTVSLHLRRDEEGAIRDVTLLGPEETERLARSIQRARGRTFGQGAALAIQYPGIKSGEVVWLGEYELPHGTIIRYDVHASAGAGIQVGFAKAGDDALNTTYYSVENDGRDCVADFTAAEPAAPGRYRLFLRSTGEELKEVTGSISLTLPGGSASTSAGEEVVRLAPEECPAGLRPRLEQCAPGGWYVISYGGRRYLSCGGFDWSFGYRPTRVVGGWRVEIVRWKRQEEAEGLLFSLPEEGELTVTVDGEAVSLIFA